MPADVRELRAYPGLSGFDLGGLVMFLPLTHGLEQARVFHAGKGMAHTCDFPSMTTCAVDESPCPVFTRVSSPWGPAAAPLRTLRATRVAQTFLPQSGFTEMKDSSSLGQSEWPVLAFGLCLQDSGLRAAGRNPH